jgi:hypothetical protein
MAVESGSLMVDVMVGESVDCLAVQREISKVESKDFLLAETTVDSLAVMTVGQSAAVMDI